MNHKFVITLLLLLWTVCPAIRLAAQSGEPYFSQAYVSNIGIINCYTVGMELSLPVISLHGNDQILLSFDDLDGDAKDYYYTVELCNHDWTPSSLTPYEYLDGFVANRINEFTYSSNTLQPYTHYEVRLPNRDVRFTKAGNYIIKIYLNDDPTDVVLTQRIYVMDAKVQITGQVLPSSNVRYRQTHQEVDFSVSHKGFPISNPFQSLHVTVMQNDRERSALEGLRPNFVRNEELVYDTESGHLFPALKEFRWVDLQSLIMLDERIKMADIYMGRQHAWVAPDEIRSYNQYIYIKDINGDFIIRDKDDFSSAINADYVMTHFTVPFDNPLPSGQLYLMGSFNNWQRTDTNRLAYNAKRQAYEVTIPLKQGYYNYLYAYAPSPAADLDFSLIEGNYFETENDYTILLYYRPFGQQHDALIGVKTINTLLN